MIVDIFDTLEKIDDLIDSSINKTIEITKKIVLTDLSSKNDRKLLVK